MRELEYTSHDGTVIDLNADDLWVADLQEMRGYAWTYTLATRGIKSVSRNASTAKMTAVNSAALPVGLLTVKAIFDGAKSVGRSSGRSICEPVPAVIGKKCCTGSARRQTPSQRTIV